jgi:hypothetical protein
MTRYLKTPKSAQTEFAAAADLAEREGVNDMKQSEVSGVPSENSTNNIRGKWTGFRIKESNVNTNSFESVVVMMTCVSFIVAPSTAAASRGKSSSAGTCSDSYHGQETPYSVPVERIHQNDAICCKYRDLEKYLHCKF